MKKHRMFLVLAMLLVALVVFLIACQKETPVARGYATKCHFDPGGNKLVCESGGSIELQSGAALNVTPGATVALGGATINGMYPLLYTSNQKVVCGSTTITGTGTLPHALATPSVVLLSLGADATGKSAHLSFTNASATVTAKVWNTALTPAASDEGVAVQWCVIGTP